MGVADEIRKRLGNIWHTLHALQREAEEGITANDICEALRDGFDVVEDYPDDPRGHSCLLLTWVRGLPLHVVCAPHEDTLIVVTMYIPNVEEWGENFRTRRRAR